MAGSSPAMTFDGVRRVSLTPRTLPAAGARQRRCSANIAEQLFQEPLITAIAWRFALDEIEHLAVLQPVIGDLLDALFIIEIDRHNPPVGYMRCHERHRLVRRGGDIVIGTSAGR